MTIITESDHVAKSLDRLPDHFDGATNLKNLLTIFAEQLQEIETVLNDLLEKRAISTSMGFQLDRIGEILNLPRKVGESDSAYRSRLFAETSELEKSGEFESVLQIFIFLTNPDNVHSFEVYPAALQLIAHTDSDPEDPVNDQQIRSAMNNVKAAGIELILQFARVADTFSLSDVSETDANGNGPSDVDRGLSDHNQITGGRLSRAF